MSPEQKNRPTWTIWKPLLISFFALAVLVGGVSAWAVNARISGAVIGHGAVSAAPIRQSVSHVDGGVVQRIHVKNGDRIKKGQLLITLDQQIVGQSAEALDQALIEMVTQEARLEALMRRDNVLDVDPLLLKELEGNSHFWPAMERQRSELIATREAMEESAGQVRAKVGQSKSVREGFIAQGRSLVAQIRAQRAEKRRMAYLAQRGLVVTDRVHRVDIELARMESELARLKAQIGETNERLKEFGFQLRSLPAKDRADAIKELNRIQPLKADLLKRRNAARAQHQRLELRAPTSGVIHDLKAQGERSVVKAGSPILFIVPDDTPLIALLRLDARDVEEVFVGKEVRLRLSAFSNRTTPPILGRVVGRSADSFFDAKKNTYFYEIEVEIDMTSVEEIEGLRLFAGMPVEGFVTTSQRSPLTYVLSPVTTYFEKAFQDG